MTVDASDMLDAFAVDMPLRPVAPEVIARALLCQEGHYVADEVIELGAHLGASPQNGIALLIEGTEVPRAILPPGAVLRSRDGSTAAFWAERLMGPPPPRGLVRQLWREPAVRTPIAFACARWGVTEEWGTSFPWGNYTPAAEDCVRHHVRLFAMGAPEGTVALAAGRLEGHGCVVQGISPVRWLFPVPGVGSAHEDR